MMVLAWRLLPRRYTAVALLGARASPKRTSRADCSINSPEVQHPKQTSEVTGMNGQSIRFGVKVAIALIVVLTIAGMLYYLQHRNKIKDETDGDEHLTAEAISTPVKSENKIASEQVSDVESSSTDSASVVTQLEPSVSEAVPNDADLGVSETKAEISIKEPKAAIARPDSTPVTPNDPDESAARLRREKNLEANARAWRTTESASEPEPEAPREPELPEVSSKPNKATRQTGLPPDADQLSASTRSYTVKQGDTLYAIAKETYGDGRYWRAIYEANRDIIAESDTLRATWKLELPPTEDVVQGN